MGAKGVRIATSQNELNDFTKYLLKDIQALDRMLKEKRFEVDDIMIGAEQELCLIDEHGRPAPKAMEILEALNHPSFTTELARFNLEANLAPVPFSGDCFSNFENQVNGFLDAFRDVAKDFEVEPLLTGILPTIRKFDLEMGNLAPVDRYYALIDSIDRLRGDGHQLKIEGLDELNIKHISAIIEACNTSFQVHLQIKPDEFVQKYNIAQAIAAPMMAIASNSPMLFGKRLWSETRIALFQQSVDTRVTGEHLRYSSPRVTFGYRWLKDSILELYKEDIVRYKTLLITDIDEDVIASLDNDITPKLKALGIHNSTVYRWNRPCYGVSPNGKPHLRIENRILPAGPTVVDEIANAAFWIGTMNGFADVHPDITKHLEFDDAKSNFLKAAKLGHGTKFAWTGESLISDSELIEKELLPIAREGLKKANVNQADIDKYLGIIEERNRLSRTGARWMVESYGKLMKEGSREEATTALVAAIYHQQKDGGKPVHEWELANADSILDWTPSSLLVEEFMTTDLFTVSKEDIPELAADMMDWQQIRYLPIENSIGELIGLLTVRDLLRHFSSRCRDNNMPEEKINDLMIKEPMTIHPEATVLEAMDIMSKNKLGCLPVVANKKLVGMITEANFVKITSSLLKRLERNKKKLKIAVELNKEAEVVIKTE